MGHRTTTADWEPAFARWLTPFLAAWGHKTRRHWAPVYLLWGLAGLGERKTVQPLAARVAPGDYEQLHHFVCSSPWDPAPVEPVLVREAGRLVGRPDAVLIVDDTGLVKLGRHSVGVARQYCGQLGKRASCQVPVSLTLARGEVPVPVALRLYLPEARTADPKQCDRAGVPPERRRRQPNGSWCWRNSTASGRRAHTSVPGLADATYGMGAEFRQRLTVRRLRWAVGILPTQHVYPLTVRLRRPCPQLRGRPRTHPMPSVPSVSARELIQALGPRAFRRLTWRRGTKGPLTAVFAAVRVRVADGPRLARGPHLPGERAWLVCERRGNGEQKYSPTNHPASASRRTLAATIKARWVCEQAHQELKDELGLDHFEGRSWRGLHHHALLTMIAFAFLQHLRLRQVSLYVRSFSKSSP